MRRANYGCARMTPLKWFIGSYLWDFAEPLITASLQSTCLITAHVTAIRNGPKCLMGETFTRGFSHFLMYV
jgi:hypothetical protein